VDWMHLARDRGQWRALMNTVINLWFTFHKSQGMSHLVECLLASQRLLRSMELVIAALPSPPPPKGEILQVTPALNCTQIQQNRFLCFRVIHVRDGIMNTFI